MAEIIWTEPAISDLDETADFVALDDSQAARNFVAKVFEKVELLEEHPKMGSIPSELSPIKIYRQIVVKPCRLLYRYESKAVYIVHVMRCERIFNRKMLTRYLK